MIKFTNVIKRFHNDETALKNINLHIDAGDIYGIVGKSGAGKSTLLRCINALERPCHGDVEVNGITINKHTGKALRTARQKIGIIFQGFNLLQSRNVFENIALPLEFHGLKTDEIKKRVVEVIELTELSDKINYYPEQLSGGQKQRVAIARALVTNPDIILCDEATSALDPITSSTILNLLKKINQTLGITIVLITHDYAVVRAICNKVGVIHNGELVEEGSVDYVFGTPKSKITKALSAHEER